VSRLGALLGLILAALLTTPAIAHEMRPAYLDMKETAPDVFAVVWKVPARGDMRLGLYLRLPDSCQPRAEPSRTIESDAYLERSTVHCDGGLKGREIAIDGLQATMTDALARVAYRDGTIEVARMTPEAPAFTVAGAQTGLEVATTYFWLGVDHILAGADHLLFVLALILLIRSPWTLVKTITAFTVAHSLTLAGATLGYVSLPQAPVEATIALSIAFLASELVKSRPGERRLSASHPWIVAFAFGLLHGFGFAGALEEIGLPRSDVPIALLTFNLGVEAGQLAFVAAVLLVFAVVAALVKVPMAPARIAAAYLIGTTAAVWLFTRLPGVVS
jgi:hydrogenase/urease accessory protein HupE